MFVKAHTGCPPYFYSILMQTLWREPLLAGPEKYGRYGMRAFVFSSVLPMAQSRQRFGLQ
jgi:hypothetical protein